METLLHPDRSQQYKTWIQSLCSPKFLWVAILGLALALRLIELGHQNLWSDELMTLNVSQTALKNLSSALALESNKPPLYFLLMHCWLRWGDTEFWVRLPSAVFGALACALVFFLGRELLGEKYGWVPSLILAVSPFHMYYSQEARMYALLVLAGAGGMLFTCRFYRTQQLRHALLYLICATVGCYTFTYGIFLLPFSCLLGLFFKPCLSRTALFTLWATNILVFLLFAPWIPRLLHAINTGVGLQSMVRGTSAQASVYTFFVLGLGSTFGPPMDQLRVFGAHIFTQAPVKGGLFIIGLLMVAAAVILGLAKLWRNHRNGFFFAVIGLGIFLGCPTMANFLNPEIPCNPRYSIQAVVPLAIALTGFVMWTVDSGIVGKLLAVIFAGFIGVSLFNNFFNPRYARDDIRSAANFAESLAPPPRHLIICADFNQICLRHYYDGPAQILPLTVAHSTVENAIKPLLPALKGSFGLIYVRPDYGDPQHILPAWLQQHYHLKLERKWTGVTFYLFDAGRS